MSNDPRYPYTYAADYIRGETVLPENPISRADASRIRQRIAEALELDDLYVACRLADAFLSERGLA